MPGITGIIGAGSAVERHQQVLAMTQSLVHEKFYKSGTFTDESLGLAVGWACHEGTFADCMPIWNEARNICLIFSGDDFADPRQVSALQQKGHQFTANDASYLVHQYEELGLGFLEKINGWFSGLLVDLRERKAMLFNDRYGMNRIYVHESKGAFYFSSEAKALLKVLPELRRLDLRGVGEFFACGCVMQNRTFFEGVTQLPGGSVWTFSPAGPVRRGAYFKPELWEEQPQLTEADYYEKLKETWTRILGRYCRGKEPVALSLTGGVDSRMILACAQVAPGELPTYTFGGMYRDCADVTVSRRVAAICHQPHETITLGREFLKEFPLLAERVAYITDGTLDPTGTADLFANRIARKKAPMRVTGLNGGELLRSLVMFKPGKRLRQEQFSPAMKESVRAAAATYAQEIQGNLLSFVVFKQAPWYLYARLSIERSQLSIRTPYFDNELAALAFQAPPGMRGIEPALRLIAEGNPALRAIQTDRASSLHSIPGVTYLRHQWQEFTFKAEYAYDYGMPQKLARVDNALAPLHLEKLFLGRHKFYHFRYWYRRELGRYLQEVLLTEKAAGRAYLDGMNLKKIVLDHTEGRGNYTTELHKILTLELMQRQLIDAN
jgi:asparagine synthase (glutamine-hydrolysing)